MIYLLRSRTASRNTVSLLSDQINIAKLVRWDADCMTPRQLLYLSSVRLLKVKTRLISIFNSGQPLCTLRKFKTRTGQAVGAIFAE